MYTATVHVTLRPSILDPQGKAIQSALGDLGMPEVEEVRTGKVFSLRVAADSAEAAEASVRQACQKLLANPVTEDVEILSVDAVETAAA
ncbi:phosphoribosylformylglycinamidine synthase [Rubrivirga sp. SAORIC476]|uniref:phosphoribosylformylglycinamidine synthase subunit PurS n=1 Tax=Rubrivirga sp. SAORIC476 TaxID=1961794 RepID=UPI000BA99F15|nr:phosphoribosylformylglycinamidine synthase subunit PurS [Rubrivirga sp. SAORIC476]MAQ95003.1 phosphoribosylformylglycinamidine synthase [Rhodothermaceae bacterium]MBC12567.1 phosphoribosylformylglycinamidine synthase [Rhodothermaceae bacterium]PAP79886.1 phosphoribosylformylglycinamidine synthase [Rubrivirga sp. SAORIC476]